MANIMSSYPEGYSTTEVTGGAPGVRRLPPDRYGLDELRAMYEERKEGKKKKKNVLGGRERMSRGSAPDTQSAAERAMQEMQLQAMRNAVYRVQQPQVIKKGRPASGSGAMGYDQWIRDPQTGALTYAGFTNV